MLWFALLRSPSLSLLILSNQPKNSKFIRADLVTTSALLSVEVLIGNYKNVTNGMTVDLTGITPDQYNTIKGAFQKAQYSSEWKIKVIYFAGKPEEKIK